MQTWISVRPILVFLVIGMALFALDRATRRTTDDVIYIDQAAIDYAVSRKEELQPGPVTEAQRKLLIEILIEDEVLVREAYKLGLENDSRIRSHLTRKMRYLLNDEQDATPSEAELKALYEESVDAEIQTPLVSFDHVYFARQSEIPEGFPGGLQDDADVSNVGDRFKLFDAQIGPISYADLKRTFGASPAKQISASPIGVWSGPIGSPDGSHFVRITSRSEPVAPSFDSVRSYLFQHWLLRHERRAIQDNIEALKINYRIIVEERKQAEQ